MNIFLLRFSIFKDSSAMLAKEKELWKELKVIYDFSWIRDAFGREDTGNLREKQDFSSRNPSKKVRLPLGVV
jgi:hypothetical protein